MITRFFKLACIYTLLLISFFAKEGMAAVDKDVRPPAIPQNLTLTHLTANSFSLSWEPSFDNVGVTEYVIFKDGYQVGTTSSTTYTISFPQNETHVFAVAAKDAIGNLSYNSNQVAFPTNAQGPASPSELEASFDDLSIEMYLNWVDNSEDETGFEVYKSKNNIDFKVIGLLPPNSTIYIDNDVTSSTIYYYKIKSISLNGNSDFSDFAEFETPEFENTFPLAEEAIGVAANQINILWKDMFNNEEAFEIYRATSSQGAYNLIHTTSHDVTFYHDKDLQPKTKYYYKIRYIISGSYSEFSNIVSGTTYFSPPTLPPIKPESSPFIWSKRGGSTGPEDSYGIDVDFNGNSYAIGQFTGMATFGSFTLNSAGRQDVFIAKYNSTGDIIWIKQIGGPGSDYGYGIKVDNEGHIYITGHFENTISAGNVSLTSIGMSDVFVIKLDNFGDVLWAKSLGGIRIENGFGLSIDNSGNCYVTGKFQYTVNFGNTSISGGGTDDIFLAKYSASGDPIWIKKAGGIGLDRGFKVANDFNGNVYLTGSFSSNVTFDHTEIISNGASDAFVAKYSPNGDLFWVKKIGGSSLDISYAIDIDKHGNVFVVGNYNQTISIGSFSITSKGMRDIYVAKFIPSGDLEWIKSFGGESDDMGNGIKVDPNGNIYVVGTFSERANFDIYEIDSPADLDGFILKLDNNGNIIWLNQSGGPYSDYVYEIGIDGKGACYISGMFSSNAKFGDSTLESIGKEDFFIAKIDNSEYNTPVLPSNPANDFDKNWTYSRVYDEAGNVIGESKSFSDNLGRSTQIQGKTFSTGHILASQTVYDENGGAVLSTLSAPINNSEFSYKENFINGRDRTVLVKTTSGQIIKLPDGTVYKSPGGEVYKTVKGEAYRYTDFKKKLPNGEIVTNPDPVANHEQGSVGWYYSNNNSSEPYVAPTDYPFSLVEEYELAPGETKKVAGPGDEHKMGLGKEGKGKSMPILQELNHYLSLRHHFVDGAVPASMYLQGMKSVSIDANGVESISFTDKSGQALASCLSGSQYPGINVSAVIGAGSDNNYLDLHLPETGSTTHLNITGSGNSDGEISMKIIDLINNSTVYEGGSGAANLPKGFYRAIILAGDFNISYLLRYGNFSYNYYDDAGRLVATVAPKGVVLGNTDYPKFVSTLKYNTLGQLLSGTDPDAGASELAYRKDGSLRFSQNAQQKIDHKFSFVNYDRLGRTLRAGEYQMLTGMGQVFENHLTATPAANSVLQPSILEDKTRTGGLDEARIISKTDSWYDRPFADPELGLRIQEFVLGKAAKTSNENSTNWYSYDERGRLVWMVQKIEGLGTQAKTIDYKYDAAGNVVEVAYQQGQADAFYHYYQYDKDQRLSKVFTSRDGTIKSLQARYTYYLHGPLKRVVLADNLQGMDYVYTVQGWLKSINHPENDKDPGKDGSNGVAPDAFGMTLDYFNGDYTRAGTNISSLDPGAEYAQQFGGSIRAMSWKTKKPTSVVAEAGPQIENPTTYAFKYDAKYQLKEATWGTPDFANKTFTASALFKEQVPEYDVHSNIISLIRNNKTGAVADNFAYNYIPNTNKLQSVTSYSSYKYDAIGQMTEETKGSSTVYLDYDESGNVTKVYTDAAKTQLKVSFFYDDGGKRVKKITHSNNVTTYYVRDASGNILASYDNNGTPQVSLKEFPIYAGGRIGQYYAIDNTTAYELTDHLGNVRALIKRTRKADGTADVIDYSDYFPFGSIARGTNTFHYKFGYQGQFAVKDEETDWNSFELRMYDAKIGKWLSADPYGEFWSPYVGMGNDPVNLVDPDGGCTKCPKPVFSASYANLEIVITGTNKSSTLISKGFSLVSSFGTGIKASLANSIKYVGNLATFDQNTVKDFNNSMTGMFSFSQAWERQKEVNNYIINIPNMSADQMAFDLGGTVGDIGGAYLISKGLSKTAAKEGTTALRKVGSVLESVDDVMANPNLLKGKSPLQVEGILGKTPGWKIETLGQGSQKGNGWVLRQYNVKGNPTGPQLRWHPGGGHHGPDPYWRVVGPNGDLGGIIR